jgi:hypothetical protein
MRRPHRRADDNANTQHYHAKQNLALIALLAELLSELAEREVDLSGIQRLEADAWAAVSRLCEDTQTGLDVILEVAAAAGKADA